MSAYLGRGLAAGLVAGLLAAVFAFFVGEPLLDRAMNLEEAGHAEKLACFFSMVDNRKAMHQDAIEELLEDRRFFEHYIPYLSDIEKMGVKQSPLGAFAPTSYGMTCFKALWAEILEGMES